MRFADSSVYKHAGQEIGQHIMQGYIKENKKQIWPELEVVSQESVISMFIKQGIDPLNIKVRYLILIQLKRYNLKSKQVGQKHSIVEYSMQHCKCITGVHLLWGS